MQDAGKPKLKFSEQILCLSIIFGMYNINKDYDIYTQNTEICFAW